MIVMLFVRAGASMSEHFRLTSLLLVIAFICTDVVLAVPVDGPLPYLDSSSSSKTATEMPSPGLDLSLPICHRKSTEDGVIMKEEGDKVLARGAMVMCGSESDYCFSYWTYDSNDSNNSSGGRDNKHVKWLAQGCFSSPDSCQQSKCAATRQSPENTFFCCCRGNFCNGNVSVPPALVAHPGAVVSELLDSSSLVRDSNGDDYEASNGYYGHENILRVPYWLLAIITVFSVCSVFAVVAFAHWKRNKLRNDGDALAEKQMFIGGNKGFGNNKQSAFANAADPMKWTPKKAAIDIASVAPTQLIGKGRFGSVYRAVSGEHDIVVKVFNEHEKESYDNELFIYSHPFMDHPNLLTCLGWGMMQPDMFGLVLPYCSGGRLSSFLSERTISWPQLCRIVYTATRGLAHLHAAIAAHGMDKPSMSHRDFNSRNLVLRPDLSCVVIDLGLAVCVKGSNHSRPGKPYATGTPPALNEAGSMRYMAPELLEGAVNLSECETALRQIDVYALGLVLWECLTRCHDLIMEEQPYQPPYQAIIGRNISLEQMIDAVVREKKRPAFPRWKIVNINTSNDGIDNSNYDCSSSTNNLNNISNASNNNSSNNINIALTGEEEPMIKTRDDIVDVSSNPGVRLIRDTIEECWDADAEARLSTLCVLERLGQLPQLWHQHPAGSNKSLDSDDKESESECQSLEELYVGKEEMFITENCYMDELPLHTSHDDTDLPAYCEQYHHPGTVSTSDASYDKRMRGFLLSNDRPGEESSTRTMETLLSPSASAHHNIMPHNVYTPCSNGTGITHCSAAVIQHGSAAPVSVLHPSSPSLEETRPMIDALQHQPMYPVNSNTNFWSRLVRKFKKDNSKSFDKSKKPLFQNIISARPNSVVEVRSPTMLVSNHSFCGTSSSPLPPPNCNDSHDFKLLRACINERQIGIATSSCDGKFEYLGSDNSDSAVKDTDILVETSVGGSGESAQWCNTVPVRRHAPGKLRPNSRPVSLEIKASPTECSSPLGNYLSTSCNFRTPDEIVLRKSKTRVKTPRHPPLPRLSLNEGINAEISK